MVNHLLLQALGIELSVLLCELISEHHYWESCNQLTSNGFFYSTIPNIEKNLGIKKSKQQTLIQKLKDLGLIHVKYDGFPQKRYIKLNILEIVGFIEDLSTKHQRHYLTKDESEIIYKCMKKRKTGFDYYQLFCEYIIMLVNKKNFQVTEKNISGILKQLSGFSRINHAKILKISIEEHYTGFAQFKFGGKYYENL